tara:strand:+ start:2973 stop:3278 length:306 start_codon:yes stop_codon:yes gene_type:complete
MKTTNNKQTTKIVEAFKNSVFQLELGNTGRSELKLSEALTLFKKDYAKENTNGYNLLAYIIRDYLIYPLNCEPLHNNKLNSFDKVNNLIVHILTNNLIKQR